jgi:hypothetical protein
MNIVKESIGFERGLSDREIKTKLVGFRKGQILISKDANINIYVFIEFMGNRLSFPAKCYIIGEFDKYKNDMILYTDFDPDWNTISKNPDFLSVPNDKISDIINKAIKDPKNQEYINKIKETLGFTPFV